MWPKLKKKYTEGYDERQGVVSKKKLALLQGKRPLWVHAVSVGEVQAAVPVIRAARECGFTDPIILSTTTETGKSMAFGIGRGLFDFHIYYPWDKARFVSSALDLLNPWAFVTTETELWPNMLWTLKDRNIPSFIANGRVSDRTWERVSSRIGRRAGSELFDLFTKIFLREERDRERLIEMNISPSKLSVMGDTKIDALLARRKNDSAARIKEEFCRQDRPIFMAGSTHTGEDEQILESFAELKNYEPKARLIVAPRHPERAAQVREIFAGHYVTSLMTEKAADWDVLVVDKIGVLFDLYGVSKAAFVGGSFADKGGQNILEPVSWGVPVQYGPHMEDFAEASEEFKAIGIASQVKNSRELAKVWIDIMSDKECDKYKKISCEYFGKKAGAAKKIWTELSLYSDGQK